MKQCAKLESLRERKKRRTRDELIAAATRLFLEQGYEGAAVDQIAAAVDVSPRTFFRYFGSKDDVLFSRHGDSVATFRRLLAAPRESETLTQLLRRAAGAVVAELIGDDPRQAIAILQLVASVPALTGRQLELDLDFEDAIAEMVAGQVRGPDAELRARLVAGAVAGAMRAAERRWVSSAGAEDPDRLLDATFRILGEGLERIDSEPQPRARHRDASGRPSVGVIEPHSRTGGSGGTASDEAR